MVEANEEKRPILEPIAREIGAKLNFALLGAKDGENSRVSCHGVRVFYSGRAKFPLKGVQKPETLQSLDSVLSEIDSIDLLKIDTQGYELEVMKGASSSTGEKRKPFYLKSH